MVLPSCVFNVLVYVCHLKKSEIKYFGQNLEESDWCLFCMSVTGLDH